MALAAASFNLLPFNQRPKESLLRVCTPFINTTVGAVSYRPVLNIL